ncbi:MAG: NUDIX hydrolase [Acidimicrobiia bacterium]
MHDWVVGGALIESDEGVLLVCNRRRDGSHDWSTPGGVIDAGESMLEGLSREVLEETGLVVTAWEGPLYEVVVHAPDMGWRLRVEAWRALTFEGEVRIDDPDGIVFDARFVAHADCAEQLLGNSRWVSEPLLAFLTERWVTQRGFAYHVVGADRTTAVVTRS